MSDIESSTDPRLLAQSIVQLQEINRTQSSQIEELQKQASKAEGSAEFVTKVMPLIQLVIIAGFGVFGSVIYSQIRATDNTGKANQISITQLQERQADNLELIDDTRARKQKLEQAFALHTTENGHPRMDERVSVIEREMTIDNEAETKQLEQVKKIEGLVERAHQFIEALKDADEKLVDQAGKNQHAIAAMAASTQANFQEVETQIRSTSEVRLTEMKNVDRLMSLLWQTTFDKPLPRQANAHK